MTLRECVKAVEKEYLVQLAYKHTGRTGDMALEAGITRPTLYYKLEQHMLIKYMQDMRMKRHTSLETRNTIHSESQSQVGGDPILVVGQNPAGRP